MSNNRIMTEAEFDMPAIHAACKNLSDLIEELKQIFPQRSFFLEQLKRALIQRAHVLVDGEWGTGKSLLLKMLFDAMDLDEGELFTLEFTRFTQESDVIGPVNIPALREEGVQRRNREGTLLTARYADLGEIFNAPHILQSLHGPLFERHLRRGADNGPIPLCTAVASTNMSPAEFLKRYPENAPGVDRFLFFCNVGWLTERDDYVTMFENYLRGATPETRVDHRALLQAARLVGAPTDQIDNEIIELYADVVMVIKSIWGSRGWIAPSDRTHNARLETLEANALLGGRYKVTAADFFALKYVVCVGGQQDQLDAFESEIKPLIEEAIDNSGVKSLDDRLLQVIGGYERELPDLDIIGSDAIQLVTARQTLERIPADIATMRPQLPATESRIERLRDRVNELIVEVEDRVAGRI